MRAKMTFDLRKIPMKYKGLKYYFVVKIFMSQKSSQLHFICFVT